MRRFWRQNLWCSPPTLYFPPLSLPQKASGRPARILRYFSILSKCKKRFLIGLSGKHIKVTIKCILDSSCYTLPSISETAWYSWWLLHPINPEVSQMQENQSQVLPSPPTAMVRWHCTWQWHKKSYLYVHLGKQHNHDSWEWSAEKQSKTQTKGKNQTWTKRIMINSDHDNI